MLTGYPISIYSYYMTDIGNNWGYIDENGKWTGAIRLGMDGVSAGAGDIIKMTS